MVNVTTGRQASGGRVRQRERTRRALLLAAAELMGRGVSPTVAEVADAADVSRATAYRYFPSQAALLVTAMLQVDADRALADGVAAAAAAATPQERATRVVGAMGDFVAANEPAFRAMLHAVLDPAGDGARGRPGNRVRWIEEALGDSTAPLDRAARHRLVAALSLLGGIETTIVLRDVCGLDAAEAAEVARWAAAALVSQALAEGRGEG